MSTPETDRVWTQHQGTTSEFFEAVVIHARRLELERDAYAETLRLIAAANDRSHHEAAFAALIRNRHPELTP
tara:strand:+ start:880 stop:1095 length:216 start_codon:yes stop_codon:yes gene_type:complete